MADRRSSRIPKVLSFLTNAVTKRKRAEEALRASEERFRKLVETAGPAIIIATDAGIKYTNPAAESLLGRPLSELLTMSVSEIVHPEDRAGVVARISGRLEGEEFQSRYRQRIVRPDGAGRWVEASATLIDYEGEPAVLAFLLDISDRVRAEEALRQFEHIVSATTDMLALIDQRYVYLAVNAAYLQAFAKTSDEVIGRTVPEEFGDEFFRTTIRPRAERCLAGEDIRYQGWFEFPAAGRKYMDITYSPYRGQNTDVQGFVVAARDITERKQAEVLLAKRSGELEQGNAELHFLESMTRVIAEAEDFESALQIMLRELCESQGWDYGEACVPCADGEALMCRPASFTKHGIPHPSWQGTEAIECPPGYGLAGRVWLSKEPEWIEDVSSVSDTLFARSPTAAEAGFKAALAFPVMVRDEVVAVFLLFRLKSQARDQGDIDVLQAIATQLGTILQRKQAEKTLRASEERFRNVLKVSRDLIYRIDLVTGSIDYVSPSVLPLTGFSPEEFVGLGLRGVAGRFHPETRGRVLAALDSLPNPEIEAGEAPEVEYRWKRKDGRYRWFRDGRSLIRDEQGRATAIVGVASDITERKQAEEALRESEARYRSFIESSHEVIFSKDREGRYRNLNLNAAVGLGGSCIEDVEGKTDYELLSREQADSVREADERVRSSRKAVEVYEVVRDAKGEDRIYLSQKWPSFNESGEVEFVNCFALDVTERKRAEEELRLRNAAVDVAANGIVVSDRDGKIVWVNAAFTALTGYRFEEAVGQSPRILRSGKHGRPFYKQLWDTVLSGQVWRGEMINRRKDGSFYTEEQTITPLSDEQGEITHFIAIKQDITERTQAEETLRRQQEEQQIILDSVPALIFYKDRENRYLRVNRTFVEASGIPREESEGGSAFDLFPNQAEEYWRDDKAVIESGQALRNIIEPMETPTGTRWYRTDKMPYRDAGGQIIGIIGFSADITEQKRLEEQLLSAREELEGKVERQMVRRNPYGLTFRELVVLHPLVAGRSDKEIATELVISPQTVHKHVANILAKMDAASRTEAATRTLREGLLE